jgi:tetratricopeptide (TPR) repeat protein
MPIKLRYIYLLICLPVFIYSSCIGHALEPESEYGNSVDTTLAELTPESTNEEKAWNHLRKAIDLARLDQDTVTDFFNATKELDKAIALDSNFAKAYHYKGLILHEQGEEKTAMAYLNKALEKDTAHLPSYFGKAAIYYGRGEYQLTIKELDKVIQIDSVNIKALVDKGSILVKEMNDKENGCWLLKKAKTLDNDLGQKAWERFCTQ